MMKGVTVESIGRVYTKVSQVMPVLTAGEAPNDVVGALLLVAVLIAKQGPWNSHKLTRRAAFMDLVGKMYDMADLNPAARVVSAEAQQDGDGHADV